MVHFYQSRGIFIDRAEESMALNGRKNEYVPYDYDAEDDIFPHLVNYLNPKENAATHRELENIKFFRRKDFPGILFRDFDFIDNYALDKLFGLTNAPFIVMLVFVNCRFGHTAMSIPSFGVGFYDCVFEERFYLQNRLSEGLHSTEFRRCTFNSILDIGGISVDHSLFITDCIFNEGSMLKAAYYCHSSTEIFDRLEIRNCIFKGDVTFEKAKIPSKSTFEYLTFYRGVNFNDTKMDKDITWQNICFAPFVNKIAKEGFKSFVKALNDNDYKAEAKYFEKQYIPQDAKKVDKTEYDIALESGWLNIKQAALFLGVKYSSLVDMRKDDKVLGYQRIPYIGEGRNSRYYVPLLKAYKNKDMKKVSELEKEMRQKENEI